MNLPLGWAPLIILQLVRTNTEKAAYSYPASTICTIPVITLPVEIVIQLNHEYITCTRPKWECHQQGLWLH